MSKLSKYSESSGFAAMLFVFALFDNEFSDMDGRGENAFHMTFGKVCSLLTLVL